MSRLPNPQRSRAVLIGTGTYSDEKLLDLPAVRNTIGDLAAALTDPAHGIIPERFCTAWVDEADIRLLGRSLRSAAQQAEDLLLVFYTGHGLLSSKRHELYLALADSEWAEPEFNSLEYHKLRDAVLDSRAANKVIILDCCFSGRVVTDAMADPFSEVVGQICVDGTYVLASAPRDQVALILPGEEHTAFTGRFIQLLRDGLPGGSSLLTIDDLYQRLLVTMRAEGLPLPEKLATRTTGLLALARNRASPVPLLRKKANTRKPDIQTILSALRKGDLRRGIVSSLVSYGAFVDIGGVDGLIHVSELSWNRVAHPGDVVKVGQTIIVRILDVDIDRGRISLSLKEPKETLWRHFMEQNELHQIVHGEVTKLAPFGAFVRIADGVEGLLHISELANWHVASPDEVVQVGDEIDVEIIEIDPARQRVGLSLRWVEEEEEYDDGFDRDSDGLDSYDREIHIRRQANVR
jgi:predicted RNA-binding protein with RPS1 domain